MSYVIYGKSGALADVDLMSLTTAQGFKISGAASYGLSGWSVSSAGDINGDGINDVIIGAPGTVNARAGDSCIIYGKSEGLVDLDLATITIAQGFKIIGAVSQVRVGQSVSSAGDINADGINDIIVGAPQTSPNGRTNAGMSCVIYGVKSVVGTIGDDVIYPSLMLEDIDGLSGINTVSYTSSTANVTVSLVAGVFGIGGYATGDRLVNFANLIGSRFADTLTGDSNNNIIEGGPGADELDGGEGIDTLTYESSRFSVTVNLATGRTEGGDATDDTIENFENIRGSNNPDILIGNAGNNIINGLGGNDDLSDGRGGNDTLTGGQGNDRFIINPSGTVTITDFNRQEQFDVLDVDALGVTFDQIMVAAVNNGDDCEITLGNKKIILRNIDKADIRRSWFYHLAPDVSRDKQMSLADMATLAGSVCSAIITAVGFIFKSYKYYKPGILGHDRFLSFASSMIPRAIKHTTANTVRAAERAIKSVVDLYQIPQSISPIKGANLSRSIISNSSNECTGGFF